MSFENSPEPQHLNPDPLYSMKQAANYLGISVSKMYVIVKEKKMPCVQLTSDRKIRKSVLDEYIKKCERPWQLMDVSAREGSTK
jgi:excisionase family DNA binding protein